MDTKIVRYYREDNFVIRISSKEQLSDEIIQVFRQKAVKKGLKENDFYNSTTTKNGTKYTATIRVLVRPVIS